MDSFFSSDLKIKRNHYRSTIDIKKRLNLIKNWEKCGETAQKEQSKSLSIDCFLKRISTNAISIRS